MTTPTAYKPTLKTGDSVYTMERCPAHGLLVPFDEDGHLMGRCSYCMGDAADALRTLIRERVA